MKKSIAYLVFAAVFVVVGAGCGNKSSSSSTAPAPTETVNLATAGSVSGTVRLAGSPPKLRPINMSAEPYCDKAHPTPVMPPEVVVGADGALANVVVYVKGAALQDYRYSTPAHPVVLDQRGCMYEPHVVALMVKQPLEVKNDDQTTHNVHALPNENPEWNESQPIGAPPFEQRFDIPEMAVPIRCNVHPWMNAYVFVFPYPYFATTGADGRFEIKNLPPGTYTVEAWQEKYGTEDQTVTIAPNQSQQVSFTFNSTTSAGQ
ncbi:MAG TPA: carboxypeptidase regulatory-like domain-containing protein [Candidatus Acidoferrum sp.]|nr:carboxypeptidase regulatory-like domain-containing protein [Candidatus Acidoferrum sp.]